MDTCLPGNYKLEHYLISNLSCKQKRALTKCRISAHDFQIELGRRQNQLREHRFCTFCDKKEIGDEFHYVLKCSFSSMVKIRNVFLEKLKTINYFCMLLPQNELFVYLINAQDIDIVSHFSSFLVDLMEITKQKRQTTNL